MNALIAAAFARSRTTLLVLLLLALMGLSAFVSIPRESSPDVPIPIMYVSMAHDGISPEDAERLLVRPMEQELQQVEGLKEMRSTASEGHGSVILEFDAGFDAKQALADVREKVDLARVELPPDSEEPTVHEINVALFPVLTVALTGPLPERALLAIARRLQEHIEALPGVLEADIGGDRAELVEVLVDTTALETYGIGYAELFMLIRNNNLLVAAGAIDTGAGRMVVKVPGVVDNIETLLAMPVKVIGERVVTFRELAEVRRGFEDPLGFARVDGEPAVTLEVKKRVGANIIETIAGVRAVLAEAEKHFPEGLRVATLTDESKYIADMLHDLQNNIASAVILVMLVIVASLGWRPSLLVGVAIPGSFLAGMLVIHAMGYTLNMIVLFALILVVGMLVDGAIVVVELAERKLAEGLEPTAAYRFAAQRMAWPVITSTLTILAVFLPLVVWPGVVGEFMKYLPITVLITLTASLAMALVFVPVLGSLVARRDSAREADREEFLAADHGDLGRVRGYTGLYVRLLQRLLRRPGLSFGGAMAAIVAIFIAYGQFGHGVEFFPSVEPDFAQVQVHARGDLSVWEKDALVREVEARVLGMPELKSVYARVLRGGDGQLAEDVIGVIQLEFIGWNQRRPASVILDEIRQRTAIPGLVIEVRKQEDGPGSGKPVQMLLSAADNELLAPAVAQVRALMDRIGGFADVDDNRPLPGVEWRLTVDRERAARHGADIAMLGNAVRMVTAGVKVADYRPDDSDEEIDIRVRLPAGERSLETLQRLRVPTVHGQVPIGTFVSFQPAPRVGNLERTDGRRVMKINADVAEGLLVDSQVRQLRAALAEQPLAEGVQIAFKGEDQDQQEAGAFLMQAFLVALFLMAIMMVTQFNSLYQALLVLSAIVFSTAGVLLGLMLTGRPFGIVMGGIGVIALAGIVVGNNIILIDTYNDLRRQGLEAFEAIVRTGAQRLRPVMLTSVTTVLGLLPMVLAVNIDLIGRKIEFGSPSTQWWTQLSSAIAGGTAFATVLTLLLTPCLLMLGENLAERWRRRREQGVVVSAP